MVSADMIKLGMIIGGGLVLLVILLIIVRKGKKSRQENLEAHYEAVYEGGDVKEKGIADYIMKYRESFSREEIKKSLIDAGNSPESCEEYLNKYYL